MSFRPITYDFFSDRLEWLFSGFVALLLILGWGLQLVFTEGDAHRLLIDCYLTFGAAAGAFLLLHHLWRARFPNYPFTVTGPLWRRYLAYSLRQLIYGGCILLLTGGFLELLFSGALTQLWGSPLEQPVATDSGLADFFKTLNRISAVLTTAGLVVYASVAISGAAIRPKSTALVFETASLPPSLPPATTPLPAALLTIALDLAKRIRIFGWIGFWIDFFLALLTAPLLAFGAVGKSLSPGSGRIGEPLHWGFIGLFLAFSSLLVDFYSTIAARRLEAQPLQFLAGNERSLWFLGASSLIGLLGSLVSLVGVGLSIALLIAKTVSQPPGIAITDPSKIVRALDVFILLGNFNLLIAHFIGASGAVWLITAALKARHRFASFR